MYFSGYGDIVPLTKNGRLFCMLYSLLGIPLCMLTLASMGKSISIRWCTRFKNISKKCKISFLKDHLRFIFTLYVMLTGVIFLLIIPGIVFVHLEGWSLLEATYFILITLTTIGFGDYNPGK